MRFISFFLLSILLVGCNSSEEKEAASKSKKKIVYDLYVPSEMANLMNVMYDENEKIKQQIVGGETPTEFPEDFLNIYTAEFSEGKYRNEVFQVYSKVFIENQKNVFERSDEISLVQRHNNAVNTCISCHTTECVGPIPRIKKLLIK